MASIYTRQLVATTIAPGVNQLLYAAPAGVTVVLRDLVVDNDTSAASSATLYLRHGQVTVGLMRGPFTVNEVRHLDLRLALEPGDELWLVSSAAAGSFGVVATGYVFT